jgi:hypothetical protein
LLKLPANLQVDIVCDYASAGDRGWRTSRRFQRALRKVRALCIHRLSEALKATTIVRVVPLWGVIEHKQGGLRCECRRGRACPSPGKHPRVSGWQNIATRDREVIRQWFERWPSMNFGAVLDDVFVLDADVKRRKDDSIANGAVELALLEDHYGESLPWTTTVETGRGQRCSHRYYEIPPGTRIRSGTDVIPGVDIKANRALAVLPGSVHHTGRLYRWMEEASPPEAGPVQPPRWLVTLLAGRQAESLSGAMVDEFAMLLRNEFGLDVDAFQVNPAASVGWRLTKLLSGRKRNHRKIIATWLHQRGPASRYPLADPSTSGYEMALADFAAANRWPPQAIVDLLVHWRRRHGFPLDALNRHRIRGALLKAYKLAHKNGRLKGKRGRKSSLPQRVATLLSAEPEAARNLAEVARRLGANPAAVRKIVQRLRDRRV